MRNADAECGMRNAEFMTRGVSRKIGVRYVCGNSNSAFRVPHSAFPCYLIIPTSISRSAWGTTRSSVTSFNFTESFAFETSRA